MDLKGSKTLENLKAAFAGESQAHTKYQYFASQAKKDGYVQIQNIFLETSKNEKEHAKIWYKLINDGVGKTADNLKDAAAGENDEWTSMYPEFAKVAREEGFDKIAQLFDAVGAIERSMRSVTSCCCSTWSRTRYSRLTRRLSGSAPTVAMCAPARLLLRSALYALIRRPIS